MNRTIISIDPGSSGGIAVTNNFDGSYAMKMPDTEGDIVNELKMVRVRHSAPASVQHEFVACVEEVNGFIGKAQPGSAMFKFGRNFGFILGCLQTLGYRIELVRPQKWQKALGLGTSKGMNKTEWKNKLKQRAQQLYPGIKVTLQTADALLLLEYAKGQHHD